MVNTISMQDMRHLNLFGKITQINTRFCFSYNDSIIFSVPGNLVSKAVGENGRNVKKMNEILGKKIKIVSFPSGIKDGRKFIEAVVSPTTFKDFEFNDREVIITAGSQSKAALIGRNKRRFFELQKIIQDFFKRDLKII